MVGGVFVWTFSKHMSADNTHILFWVIELLLGDHNIYSQYLSYILKRGLYHYRDIKNI